jgi:tRNA threonylcarbamoyladenosine biosynthesis protein TsaB
MLLAIDTSTRKALLAIADADSITSRQFEPRATQRVIFAELAALLKNDILDKLDAIAVGLGPGSFTGVKIGVMAAKALAWSRGVSLAGVGSLDAVAAASPPPDNRGTPLVIAVPSTRGEVYIQTYEFEASRWIRRGEIHDVSLESDDLPALFPSSHLMITGEAAESLARALNGRCDLTVMEERLRYPTAEGLVSLAQEKLKTGETDDPLALIPDYVRLSQPERRSEGGGS